MRPGEHPLRELDRAIWAALPESRAGAGSREPRTCHSRVRRRRPRPSGERLVLVVDQFEELFTACTDEAERAAFVDALVEAADEPRGRRGVGGRRARRLLRPLRGPIRTSPSSSAANQVLVGAMSADEYRRAIEQPALRAGVRVEPALVDDARRAGARRAGRAAAALDRAARALGAPRRPDDRVARATSATGGVRGAVARLAEDVVRRPRRRAAGASRARPAAAWPAPARAGAVVRRRVPLAEFDTERDEQRRRAARHPGEAAARHGGRGLGRGRPRGAAARVAAVSRTGSRRTRGPARARAPCGRGARVGRARPRRRPSSTAAPGCPPRSTGRPAHEADLNPTEREFLAASRAQHQAQMRRLRVAARRGRRPARGGGGRGRRRACAARLRAPSRPERGRPAARRPGGRRAAARPGAPARPRSREPRVSHRPRRPDLWATILRARPPLYAVQVPCRSAKRTQLALSPDGRTLAVGDGRRPRDGLRRRTRTGRIGSVVPPEFGAKQAVWSLAFSHDGRTLAVGGHRDD